MVWIIVSIMVFLIAFIVLGIDFEEGSWRLQKRQLFSLLSVIIIKIFMVGTMLITV